MDCTNNPSGIQNLIICIPVYNDWESLMVLVERSICSILSVYPFTTSFLLYDISASFLVICYFHQSLFLQLVICDI